MASPSTSIGDRGVGGPEPAVDAEPAIPPADRVPSRRVWAAIAAASLWLLTLAVLAVWTANPVVFNRSQFLQADLVVEADEQTVYEVWPLTPVAKAVVPDRVVFDRPRDGRQIVPLRRAIGGWEVVPVRLDADRPPVPLTYPATEASRTDLAAFLDALAG